MDSVWSCLREYKRGFVFCVWEEEEEDEGGCVFMHEESLGPTIVTCHKGTKC
jgi:hypothetical protein